MGPLEIADFAFSAVTATCALYISYVSLAHSAKPRGIVRLASPTRASAGEEIQLQFEFTNIGHWYAKPPIVELNAWMNFDPAFELLRLQYGSALELETTSVRTGKGGLRHLKAKGLKLTFGGGGETVVVHARTPSSPGRYLIKVDAFSENGAAIRGRWTMPVTPSKVRVSPHETAPPSLRPALG